MYRVGSMYRFFMRLAWRPWHAISKRTTDVRGNSATSAAVKEWALLKNSGLENKIAVMARHNVKRE